MTDSGEQLTASLDKSLIDFSQWYDKPRRPQQIAQALRVRLSREEVKTLQKTSVPIFRSVREQSFSSDFDLEEVLRVRLYPLLVTAEAIDALTLPDYQAEVGPLIASYFHALKLDSDRLLGSWEDVCAAVNFITVMKKPKLGVVNATNKLMQRLVDSAVKHRLIPTLLTVVSWVDLPLLVKLDLKLLKADIDRAHLSEQFYTALLSRVTDSPYVFGLLLTALEFAGTPQLRESVASLSLKYLRPAFGAPLTVTQRILLSAIVLACTASLVNADLPIQELFAHSDSIPAGKLLVVQQIILGIHRYRYYKSLLCDATIASCFHHVNIGSVIAAQRWDALTDLRIELDIDESLSSHLQLLLELHAPESFIIFTDLLKNLLSIKKANIPIFERKAVLKKCLCARSWDHWELKEAGNILARINAIETVFTLLFVKARSVFSRVPGLLLKEIVFGYLI